MEIEGQRMRNLMLLFDQLNERTYTYKHAGHDCDDKHILIVEHRLGMFSVSGQTRAELYRRFKDLKTQWDKLECEGVMA
jgi:hypothetical protein